MDEITCRRLLSSAESAALATIGESGPHLVPIVFVVRADTVYTAIDHKPKTTNRLQRLVNIEVNPTVALLVDHYVDDWDALWWVRADGRATILTDGHGRQAGLDLLASKYAEYRRERPTGPVIAIEIGSWSGWSAMPVA
jgi:PPOX class probable F420-dependent enzyme